MRAIKLSGKEISEDEIELTIAYIDCNNNDMINYSEFMVAATDRSTLLTKRRIESCFKWFDIVKNTLT